MRHTVGIDVGGTATDVVVRNRARDPVLARKRGYAMGCIEPKPPVARRHASEAPSPGALRDAIDEGCVTPAAATLRGLRAAAAA